MRMACSKEMKLTNIPAGMSYARFPHPKNGFNPADEHFKKKTAAKATNKNEDGLIVKAKDVFTRVPTLWALFCEILACQGLSTLLNVLCVTKVSEVILDDTERAGWMGKVSAQQLIPVYLSSISHCLGVTLSCTLVLCDNQYIKLCHPIWDPTSHLFLG